MGSLFANVLIRKRHLTLNNYQKFTNFLLVFGTKLMPVMSSFWKKQKLCLLFSFKFHCLNISKKSIFLWVHVRFSFLWNNVSCGWQWYMETNPECVSVKTKNHIEILSFLTVKFITKYIFLKFKNKYEIEISISKFALL